MKILASILLQFLIFNNAYANLKSYLIDAPEIDEKCQIRVIESTPNQKINSDYFFFIGYGDRADNHLPLFNKLNSVGNRVISFDYPGHGLSKCNYLNSTDFTKLMKLVSKIELHTRPKQKRPIILSGWSTGGLLALRLAQDNVLNNRPIKSLELIAPGISVYPLVGGDGIIRNKTLLNNPNPPHMGPPIPISPLLSPFFSSSIIFNGLLARQLGMPNISTLVLIADDHDDLYAKSFVLKSFFQDQKLLNLNQNLNIVQCQNSKHEMDNEWDSIGEFVRNEITKFSQNTENQIGKNNFCGEI